MKLEYRPFFLEFKHPFGVHGHSRSQTLSVFVRLTHQGLYGYGEACLPAYLGGNLEGTLHFLKASEAVLNPLSFELNIFEIRKSIDEIGSNNNAAKAAIDIALNDLLSKQLGLNFRLWKGLQQNPSKPSALTIGIDHADIIKQKITEAADFQILKVKLGTNDDKGLIRFIRKYTNKPIYVDVNQGWTSKEKAIDMLCWLSTQNVLLVEQPMPIELKKEMKWLTKRSPIPTIADESVKRFDDLKKLEGEFSGINIKLMKSTGLTEAMEMIKYAQSINLKVMLGCMAESSCATTAMAQLIQYADFVDLDAPQLYTNDPFIGLSYKHGNIHLNLDMGIGVAPTDVLFDN